MNVYDMKKIVCLSHPTRLLFVILIVRVVWSVWVKNYTLSECTYSYYLFLVRKNSEFSDHMKSHALDL